tara:strand:+ start:391 stop:738 length:348 start_codon:yes stop_codon:yes gene_type:complete
MIKKINKPWGWEKIIENNKHYTLKKLFMKKNSRCSLQFHKKKIETIYVLDGPLYLLVGKNLKKMKTIKLNKGQSVTLNKLVIHRMFTKNKSSLYLEASTSQLKDVVRLSDDYNRV